jgi:hypothetical protein
MAYEVSFGDIDTEVRFWELLHGYCVEIAGKDYEIAGGLSSMAPDYTPTLEVRAWDDDTGTGAGEPFGLPLTGDEEVMVY